LSYNLRVGTTPGGNEVSAAMSAAGGFRRVARLGNTDQRLSWTLAVPSGATCYWSVQGIDGVFAGSPFAPEQSTVTATGVPGGETAALPTKYRLDPGAPNPASERTTIRFELPETTPVSLDIFEVSGRLVRRLAGGDALAAGRYAVSWDGRNQRGEPVASGVYLVRLVPGLSGAGDARAVTGKVVIDRAR
jgi:hypothetical protein